MNGSARQLFDEPRRDEDAPKTHNSTIISSWFLEVSVRLGYVRLGYGGVPSPGEATRFFDADAKVPKQLRAGTFYFVRAWRDTCVCVYWNFMTAGKIPPQFSEILEIGRRFIEPEYSICSFSKHNKSIIINHKWHNKSSIIN